MYDVVAIGEMLIDFTTDAVHDLGYPIMSAHPGGAPANFLATLSKFGMKTALVSKVGNDAFGNLLIGTAKAVGIDASHIKRTDEVFTTLAFVTHDENGDRSFSFARKPGADTALTADDIDPSLLKNTRVLHFGTVGMTNEPSRQAHKYAVEQAKKNGVLISFDPNLREPLWQNLSEAKEQMLWGLSVADVVKISDNEVEFLFGLEPLAGAKHIVERFDTNLVFVTLGKSGAIFANKKTFGSVENYTKGIKTVDTTGAGDIFGGSAMFKILESGCDIDRLTKDQLVDICNFACKSASLSTTKLGGLTSVPNLSEI